MMMQFPTTFQGVSIPTYDCDENINVTDNSIKIGIANVNDGMKVNANKVENVL